ncbi:transcriptional regulator of RNA polII, SAGA, subunit-domain-containing protein [Amylocystis lapponica]|nr:transcriptional regulator of RNA polII, SAGA, subunit-domain-containing protein [Amylocystis lapponica]
MSLLSTSTIKSQLSSGLGEREHAYWRVLREWLSGNISRIEFDEQVKECLDTIQLLQLHNALIVSLFDTSAHLAPPTPPPDVPKPPPHKRRRTLPYQGPDTFDPALSHRLKRWTVGMGPRERERVRALPQYASLEEHPSPDDEISAERGVQLLRERGEPPGSRLPLHLPSTTRTFALQHLTERLNLVSTQHDLQFPGRQVSSLLLLATEAMLKNLITQAMALTTSSHAITSIRTSSQHSHSSVLTLASFVTLFTVSPAVLPQRSAAAMRLMLGENDAYEEEFLLKDREVKDQRWQLFAMVAERSTVKEALRTLP